MPSSENVETDLVIIGGGIMGTAVAYQAATLGIKSVVLENQNLIGAHYASSFWAPRADYLPKDIDEVERSDSECAVWQNIFPDIFKPKLFLVLINDLAPHGFDNFKSLMELYDRLTPNRLRFLPSSHFCIDRYSLKQMEPNLKRGYFDKAIGFYEFTADPNAVRDALWRRTIFLTNETQKLSTNEIRFGVKSGHINEIVVMTKDHKPVKISNRENRLIVVNATGSWMNEVADLLGISLPITLYGGIQLAFPQKYRFSSVLISFAEDGKYVTVVPRDDHIQVGPSNIRLNGRFSDFLENKKELGKHAEWIKEVFSGMIEPGAISKESVIRSVGARVKLNSILDFNRPFVIPADEWGINNFFSIYPGKLPASLRAADELLKLLSERELVSGKQKFFLGPKSRVGIIVSSDRLNVFLTVYFRLKSLYAVGYKLFFDKVRKFKKPRV